MFILVTSRSLFDVYLLSFSSADSTVNSSKIYLFLLWSKRVYPAVRLNQFVRIDINQFLFFYLGGPTIASIYKNGKILIIDQLNAQILLL